MPRLALQMRRRFCLTNAEPFELSPCKGNPSKISEFFYFKKGIWTVYLLEFNKKETAQKVLYLLTH